MGIGLVLIAYGALIGLGGVLAFARAKSRPSLVVGVFAGGLLIIFGAVTWMGIHGASYVGLAMTLLLCALFGLRYRRTKKVRPAGVMFVVSFIVAAILGYLLLA